MSGEEELWIEIRGLAVAARVGVTDRELETERALRIDIDLIPLRRGALDSDAIEDTVDYAAVAAIAERIATDGPHRTLERLASRIADAVLDQTGTAEVGVRVAKPDPPMAQTVAEVAVRLGRSGGGDG